MGAGHVRGLFVERQSPVHRLPAQVKLVAVVAFVFVVVSTPREQVWAFAAFAGLLAGVAALARVPAPTVARRMLVEVPFLLFAVLMPFVVRGERTEVLGVSVSVAGLWAAWNLLAKATLGVVASILLAATTDLHDLLTGLQRLRMPALIVQIMSFMIRYGDVVSDEMARMRIARESRGFEGRDIRHLPVVARSAGALFIRSYERGERVHLAMLSRGYDGAMPVTRDVAARPREWATGLALPATALVVALLAWASA
jgi:cobalt/nickel transport system permease protein